MKKVLIADDSQFMRKVLHDILTKNGYTDIIEASTGTEAIEKFNSEKPDLVLSDIIMPEKDGVEVLKEIVPQGAQVLVISAVGQEDMIKQATDAGAKGYIIKPFEETQVLEEINKLLS